MRREILDFEEDTQEPLITPKERAAISFSTLSSSIRHDIMRSLTVKRFHDGDLIWARGEPPTDWTACAKGAARVSSTSLTTGKPGTQKHGARRSYSH
jgi:hypothetical protein